MTRVFDAPRKLVFDAWTQPELTARLAPRAPMRHVWILAIIGLIAGIGGVFAGMQMHMGPLWYPIGIAVTAVPCTLLGGVISRRVPRVD